MTVRKKSRSGKRQSRSPSRRKMASGGYLRVPCGGGYRVVRKSSENNGD